MLSVRIRWIQVSFFLLLLGLALRAAVIQLFPDSRLTSLQQRQFETTVTLGARRGDILDRNGNELAASKVAWSLFADPKLILDPFKTAHRIASETNLPPRKILSLLVRARRLGKRFLWIERQLDQKTKDRLADKIKGSDLKGLGFIEEPKRIYPNESLLANVLGFVGHEGQGLEGLELKLNEQLSPSQEKVSLPKDARGRPLIVNGQAFVESPQGQTVELTIDREIQFVVEKELLAATAEFDASSAVALVLDAQTSEVLAMATVPTFDANSGTVAKPDRRRNRTIVDAYEPGSTMKTFVVAEAFEKKLLEPNSRIFAENGSMKVGDRIIREADAQHSFGWITVTELLAHSSNIGATKVAQKLGPQAVRDAMARFGFGERLGIDLPGEAHGTLQPLPWNPHLLANVSFGHGVSATPLQVANAYASIANGGWLKRPYVVKRIFDPNGILVEETHPQTLRKVLGEEALAKLKMVLINVTSDEGTGFNARVIGYPVAGKTGTAQRIRADGKGYEVGAYLSSFAGFVPANDPKFVIYVALDRPRKQYYGAAVAAPVFSKIAQFAVRKAGLIPVLIGAKNVIPKDATFKARNPAAEANHWKRENGLEEISVPRVQKASEGPTTFFDLANQTGANNSVDVRNLPVGPKGLLGNWRGKSDPQLTEPKRPDLIGLPLQRALEKLSEVGVSRKLIHIKGRGFVARSVWSPGGSVELELTQ